MTKVRREARSNEIENSVYRTMTSPVSNTKKKLEAKTSSKLNNPRRTRSRDSKGHRKPRRFARLPRLSQRRQKHPKASGMKSSFLRSWSLTKPGAEEESRGSLAARNRACTERPAGRKWVTLTQRDSIIRARVTGGQPDRAAIPRTCLNASSYIKAGSCY